MVHAEFLLGVQPPPFRSPNNSIRSNFARDSIFPSSTFHDGLQSPRSSGNFTADLRGRRNGMRGENFLQTLNGRFFTPQSQGGFGRRKSVDRRGSSSGPSFGFQTPRRRAGRSNDRYASAPQESQRRPKNRHKKRRNKVDCPTDGKILAVPQQPKAPPPFAPLLPPVWMADDLRPQTDSRYAASMPMSASPTVSLPKTKRQTQTSKISENKTSSKATAAAIGGQQPSPRMGAWGNHTKSNRTDASASNEKKQKKKAAKKKAPSVVASASASGGQQPSMAPTSAGVPKPTRQDHAYQIKILKKRAAAQALLTLWPESTPVNSTASAAVDATALSTPQPIGGQQPPRLSRWGNDKRKERTAAMKESLVDTRTASAGVAATALSTPQPIGGQQPSPRFSRWGKDRRKERTAARTKQDKVESTKRITVHMTPTERLVAQQTASGSYVVISEKHALPPIDGGPSGAAAASCDFFGNQTLRRTMATNFVSAQAEAMRRQISEDQEQLAMRGREEEADALKHHLTGRGEGGVVGTFTPLATGDGGNQQISRNESENPRWHTEGERAVTDTEFAPLGTMSLLASNATRTTGRPTLRVGDNSEGGGGGQPEVQATTGEPNSRFDMNNYCAGGWQ